MRLGSEVRDPLTVAVEIVYSPSEDTCFEKHSTFAEGQVLDLATPTAPSHEFVWLSLEEACDSNT